MPSLRDIFLVVVQLVIRYRLETWVVKPHMGRVWRVLPQVVPQADMEATSERTGRSLSLSPAGGIDGRVRLARGGDLLLPPPEHRRKVYFKQAHYGPVYGR